MEAAALSDDGAGQSPDQKRKKTARWKDCRWPGKAPKAKLSRGFGSAVRLRYHGGALQLPSSPGPAAYEVPRDMDQAAEWTAASLQPWGRRTSGRSSLRNPTATDTGPGEHSAIDQFTAYRPAPKFAQRLTAPTKDNFPDPARYDLGTTIGTGFAWKVGTSARGADLAPRSGDNPGPAHYSHDGSLAQRSRRVVFGNSERRHPGDGVDPDEPPGPGAHRLPSERTGGPSAAWPKDERLKRFPGMGPPGHPPVGHYHPAPPQAHGVTMAGPLERPRPDVPGPADYEPRDDLTADAAPAWATLSRTAPRKSPFVQASEREASSVAMLRRAAAAAAAAAAEEGHGDSDATAFAASGPSWSLGARRPLLGPKATSCKTLYGRPSSLG